MSSWYFVKNGERVGPLERAELDARVRSGEVGSETLVWTVGMGAWMRAGAVTELGLPPPPPRPADADGRGAREADEVEEEEGNATARYATEAEPMDAERMLRERLEQATVRGGGMDYAGFGVRLAAKLVDLVIFYGMGLIVQGVVAAVGFDGVVPHMLDDWEEWARFALIAGPINLVVVLAYSVYFIRRYEATPGKRLLGLRVVRADGGRVGVGRVIGRHFAEQVSTLTFFAGYVMAAFDEEKRTLHDMMCGTRVVRGPREDETAKSETEDGR
jgi:uncharacterized RDD family membrane protein YckC